MPDQPTDEPAEAPDDRPDHESEEADLEARDEGAHAEKVGDKANFEPGDLSGD